MEIDSQLRKGSLELCILSLIEKQDRYGYELVELISEYFDVSEGTVYPILRRLTRDGFCDTYLAESSEGPPRKYYGINASGQKKRKSLQNQWEQFAHAVNTLLSEAKSDKRRIPKKA